MAARSKHRRHTVAPSVRPPRPLAWVAPLCFFVSGGAGLVYEVLWMRLIDKLIGSAPFAVATVLAVFMAGLALGGYLTGRRIDRVQGRDRLLKLHGCLEIGIGLWALILPLLVAALKPVYRLIYDPLLAHPGGYQAAALVGCVLVLIVPAGLMGATLPVLSRYYVTRMDHLGRRAGWLYGLNTVGAAFGSVLCGFVLIKSLGVWGTLGATAAVNLLVGGACLWLARRMGPTIAEGAAPAPVPNAPPAIRPLPPAAARQNRYALWLFAVSGACAMAYQVLWTRLLGLIVGPTTYVFTIVVATFIVGLALGSIFFGRLADRLHRPFQALVATQLAAALLALAVSHLLGNSQFLFAKLILAFQEEFGHLLLAQSLILFVLLLGPTLFLGAAFPLVNRIYVASIQGLGNALGKAYALNTVGAIVGSVAAGFLLGPWLGKQEGLRLVAAIQMALALGAMGHAALASRPRAKGLGWTAALAGCAGALVFHFPAWSEDLLSRGWYRDAGAIAGDLDTTGWGRALWHGADLLGDRRRGIAVVFRGEGVGGFTTVEQETTSLGTVEYALFNSGKADASSHNDRSTQTLSGHIPLLFHPRPQNVMVLGLASGMTSGEVLRYPIERLDILEINAQVVAACRRFFTPWNNRCLDDPRTRLILQDGRNHLALTGARYDVIISEHSNPWMAGLANLYTLDFFRSVKARLTDQGIFAQWIQSYEMDWETFSLLGRTFTAVFDRGALFKVGTGDYLLVGCAGERALDWEIARSHLVHAQSSPHLTLRGIAPLAHLVVTEDLPLFFGHGPLHTDDRPLLEYAAPRRLHCGGLDPDLAAGYHRRLHPATQRLLAADGDALLDLVEMGASLYLPLFTKLNAATLTPAQHVRYMAIVGDYCDATLVPTYRVLGDLQARAICAERQIQGIRRHLARAGGRAGDHYNLGLALNAAAQTDEAVRAFTRALTLDPDHAPAHSAMGLLHAQAGDFPQALRHLRRASELTPGSAEAYRNLGMAEAGAGELAAAAVDLTKALRISPGDAPTLNQLGLVQMRLGRVAEARATLAAALAAEPSRAETHHNLGLLCYTQGEMDQAVTHFQKALRLSPDNANAQHNLRAALARAERLHAQP